MTEFEVLQQIAESLELLEYAAGVLCFGVGSLVGLGLGSHW